MEINKVRTNHKCKMLGCKNLAEFVIQNLVVDENLIEKQQNFYFCESCAQKIYKGLSKEFVPKTIKSIFNKIERF